MSAFSMKIIRETWYYFIFALASAAYIATVDVRLGLYWLAGVGAGFFAGRCSVLGWRRRKEIPPASWPVASGYTVRESHMENGVHVITKADLHHVSIVQEKPR